MVAYWRSLAGRAWASAMGGRPGPVHLNVAFRDPLTPEEDDQVSWPESLEGRSDQEPWTRGQRCWGAPEPFPLPMVERGVIVCGDGDYDPDPFLRLAELTGWQLLAERTSNARRAGAI